MFILELQLVLQLLSGAPDLAGPVTLGKAFPRATGLAAPVILHVLSKAVGRAW